MKGAVASLLLWLMPVMLAGCVVLPVPHTSQESPSLKGRVIDEKSGLPISNAVVIARIRPNYDSGSNHGSLDEDGARAVTRADGTFVLGSRYNLHLLWYANLSFQLHYPGGAVWNGQLLVTHPDYLERHFIPGDNLPGPDVGTIGLTRRPSDTP